jgi:protein-L-isoaspartate(D-aspartate) O-methyltransferase
VGLAMIQRELRRLPWLVLLVGLYGCEPNENPGARPGVEEGKTMSTGEEARFIEARKQMVENLETIIKDRTVLEVMGRVPRHEFVPEKSRDHAYAAHSALSINENQTISAPDIVGIMTELLQLDGTERVLEIGTGSGYQAAVLGEIVSEVYTVEILPRLAESSRALLASLQDRGVLRKSKVEVIEGDGYNGYPDKEPYDAIIVTAAPAEIPILLFNQLKKGGRMVIPVGDFHQELQVVTKDANGEFSKETILPVRFVPMVKESDS